MYSIKHSPMILYFKKMLSIINKSIILVEYHHQPEEMFNRDRIYLRIIMWGWGLCIYYDIIV